MLPGHPPAKKARPLGTGGDEDPRGLLRIADAAKAPVGAGLAPPHVSPKGLAKGKHAAVPAFGPEPPPEAKHHGKGKGKGKGKAKAPALVLPPPAPAAAPPPAPPSPDFVLVAPAASSSSSSKAAAPPAPAAVARRKPQKKDYKPAIGRGEVFYQEYREFGFGKLYKNWIFKCPHHDGCHRTMGVISKNTGARGILEPLAYLHVWRDVVPSDKSHRLTDAEPADVVKFFDDHEIELEDLGELFGIERPP